MVGLALARSIAGFEPLQVTRAVVTRERPVRVALVALLFAVLAAVVAIIVGSIGLGVLQSIFHETNVTREASSSLSQSKFQAFFLLLAGAGIVEELLFRLVGISLLIRVFKARWLAVVLTAVLFGLYHITPLSGMYKTFLQMPVSQVVATIPLGLIWGWLFLRKGYESAVAAHTLCDWLPMMVFG
jgi:membrane protease YdiL (CAAX protease family)